jgi:hypothetical protein
MGSKTESLRPCAICRTVDHPATTGMVHYGAAKVPALRLFQAIAHRGRIESAALVERIDILHDSLRLLRCGTHERPQFVHPIDVRNGVGCSDRSQVDKTTPREALTDRFE